MAPVEYLDISGLQSGHGWSRIETTGSTANMIFASDKQAGSNEIDYSGADRYSA
jgi:hypothetical protein